MSGFHEVQFPPDIAYGATGGPGYTTSILTTVSGHERRNAAWAEARGRWNVASGLKRRDQVEALIAFFRARKGRAWGFRFKDWTDFEAADQPLGMGDGSTRSFQLARHYVSAGVVETRTIAKPVPGSLAIRRDGNPVANWSVDTATGIVTFSSPPPAGAVLTADFAFDVPARFDTDQMDLTLERFALGSWGQIPIVEIRP